MTTNESSKSAGPVRRDHVSLKRYRVLSEQAHSAVLEQQTPFRVSIGEYQCAVFFKPAHSDPNHQRILGGTVIHLEFEAEERDVVRAAAIGIQLTEDVLAGLALIRRVVAGRFSQRHLLDGKSSQRAPASATVRLSANCLSGL